MPETYTQIVVADTLRRQQAWNFEQATRKLANVKRSITDQTAKAAKLREQVDLLTKMETLAKGIDPANPGKGGMLARDQILGHVSYALADQQFRLEQTETYLATLRKELPRFEQAVAEFTT